MTLHRNGDPLLDDEGHPDADAIMASYWHPDGLYPHEAIIAAALAVDGLMHYLARATWAPGNLPNASDVYRIIGELRSAFGRFDQVLDQLSRRAAALVDDPTLYDDRRSDDHPAAATALALQGALDAAQVPLGMLGDALGAAHNASGHLGHNR